MRPTKLNILHEVIIDGQNSKKNHLVTKELKNNIWIYLAIKENIRRKKNRKLGNVFSF